MGLKSPETFDGGWNMTFEEEETLMHMMAESVGKSQDNSKSIPSEVENRRGLEFVYSILRTLSSYLQHFTHSC